MDLPAQSGLVDDGAFQESLVDVDDALGAANAPDAGQELEAQIPGEADDPGRPSWVGKQLGHFRLLSLLGQGAMGLVIRAQDITLGRIVALKVLRKRIGKLDEEQRVSQFLREARAAARIEHPCVAHVYEINHHKGWWYIATELIEGGTLLQVVKAAGRLAPAQACPLIADAASALAAAHQIGIIHRDVKPQNLMITRGGRGKVVDFGLVRVEDPNDPFDFTRRAVGTPMYLAPEAADKKPPSGALDVYGLGATLYFALTGRPPFPATDARSLAKDHAQAPRPDAREGNPDCSERLSDLIKRAMAVDPDERPSAAEMASILRVENIGQLDPSSLIFDASGTSVLGQSQVHLSGTPGLQGSQLLGSGPARERATPAWVWITRIAAASVVLGVLVYVAVRVKGWYGSLGDSVETRAAFADRFPTAPASYGVRPAGTVARPDSADGPPPFSWQVEPAPESARFVASRRGRHYYPIDHPDAALIPTKMAVFYDSAEAARADRRRPLGD